MLAATDQGLAGSFGSSDFEQSAGKFWQQNLLRSEKIQDLSELREQPMGNMSDDSIFHNGAWTRPACRLEYRIEETCQELRDMSFTHTRMSAHLLATPSRGTTALTSYVENEETSCEPFRTQSTEQQFSRSLIYRHRETKQAPISRIAAHWSLHKAHADGDEEERADTIWSASQGVLFHQQQFPQEQPYHISSSTSKRHGEVERQRFEKHKSDRGRPERQHSDSQLSERSHYDRQQRNEYLRFEQRRDAETQPSECQRCDMEMCEPQKTHRSRSDAQPEFRCPHTTSEASVLDNWKLLLLALEELNSSMIVEEVKAVEQMNEGRRALHNRGTEKLFTPGAAGERIKQILKLGPLSEGVRSGKSRNPFQCTVTGPYWEWNSVSPTNSFSKLAVTESIQQASDRVVIMKWMSEHSRNTLLEHVGRLRELHRSLSNESDRSRLICKPLLEWMVRSRIGDTDKSRAQANQLKIVLAGRERARAQMLSPSEHRVRFADRESDHGRSKIAHPPLFHRLPRARQHGLKMKKISPE